MSEYNIYSDIAQRTDGDVYLGVVGPVRTGKSTFIKRFMDLLVIPSIDNAHKRERAMDELPQSAGGRMIMTTEPKFIPNEAVEIRLEDSAVFKIRLIDCVGYIVGSALGYIEGEAPRMVMTPWSKEAMPFAEAAELGTKKVITEHSTVGIVVTTDGSVTDIDRDEYIEAEERVIAELKAIGKPFVVVLNTINPYSEQTETLIGEMKEHYGVGVVALNCREMNEGDIGGLVRELLLAFPALEIGINLPSWVNALEGEHPLKKGIRKMVRDTVSESLSLSDALDVANRLGECEYFDDVRLASVNMGDGTVVIDTIMADGLFYRVLEEATGFKLENEEQLMTTLSELSAMKQKYDKIAYALEEVNQKGYGIVSPSIDELTLEEPEIVKQGSRFGVRLKASAPSIHIMCNKPKSLEAA